MCVCVGLNFSLGQLFESSPRSFRVAWCAIAACDLLRGREDNERKAIQMDEWAKAPELLWFTKVRDRPCLNNLGIHVDIIFVRRSYFGFDFCPVNLVHPKKTCIWVSLW